MAGARAADDVVSNSLAPLLRGRDEQSSLLEGRGEGLLPRWRWALCSRKLPLTRIRATLEFDLSPQEGRGDF
ncbi:hypothetical protein XH93_13130 [Bradyrhizobium sp. CCBAU 51753]|nr:hypothetical protein XH93_13130 [Bradyrhizobium sp. CCBAU 51753]